MHKSQLLSGAPLVDGKTYTVDHVVQEFEVEYAADSFKEAVQTRYEVVKSAHKLVIRSLAGITAETVKNLLQRKGFHVVNVAYNSSITYFQG